IDEDDIEEMNIKWNVALLRWDWSYIANEEENHALVAYEEASSEFALMAKSSSSSENEMIYTIISKVYEPEVQKKSESNSQNMAFISSAKNSSGKGEVNTTSILTASTKVSPASADIDEDDIEEMNIKWNVALLRWDWSYIANEEENHALVAYEEASSEFALMAKSSSSSENEVFDNS
nr:hypothetical protein [Tanacetum cinerariifolium]